MTTRTSRRRFLMQLGGAAAAGLSAPLWIELVQRGGLELAWGTGEFDALPLGTPVCVHISLDGGNDYLNTLAPVGDAWYKDTTYGHGGVALSSSETTALTGTTYRLHSKLSWLANRWNTSQDVAFVLGVGNDRGDFSHFESMKYWDTSRLDLAGQTGWLGRYADATRPQNAVASVSMSDLRLDAMPATAPALVVHECSTFTLQTGSTSSATFAAGARQMSTIDGTDTRADVARMMATALDVSNRIAAADDQSFTGSSTGYASYGQLTQDLVQTALLIRAGLPAQSYSVTHNGYDSHVMQKQMQTLRFTELDDALTKFFAVMNGHARQHDVFVLITSEFGRQMTANKNAGTDHGQAGMAMFVGGGTCGGIFGDPPTLNPGGATRPNRINDALKPTADFRSVHATALNRLAKGDTNVADSVLGAHYEDFGVFDPSRAPVTTTTSTTAPPATTTTSAPPTTTTTAPPSRGRGGLLSRL
ncbi:MAG TPA: DUF1501 domain-containing protein [Acidimicrobiales bacterium]|nr:DUF1501 domain-containing protein [Acidimicrobiales bacterium]